MVGGQIRGDRALFDISNTTLELVVIVIAVELKAVIKKRKDLAYRRPSFSLFRCTHVD